MQCIQIALSVADSRHSLDWYERAFGLVRSGEFAVPQEAGVAIAELQGLPAPVDASVKWLLGSQDFFQLEFFDYAQPPPRPRSEGALPSDVGYSLVEIEVSDLDAALVRLAALGAAPLGEPLLIDGRRSACVMDPDGIFLQIGEPTAHWPPVDTAIVRPQIQTAFRTLRASVPDLSVAQRFFRDLLGLQAVDGVRAPHGPEHEALWGLSGAKRDYLALDAGAIVLELVEYLDPPGAPRAADYRLCDHGILNLAFGTRDSAEFDSTIERVREAGYRVSEEIALEFTRCVYVEDANGFSVEFLYVQNPEGDGTLGFTPIVPQ